MQSQASKGMASLITDEGSKPQTLSRSFDKVQTSYDWQEHFSQFHDITDALPCQSHLLRWMWFMNAHSVAPKIITDYGNQVLVQDTTHLWPIQFTDDKSMPRSRRHLDHIKIWALQSGVAIFAINEVRPKPYSQDNDTWEEYKADKRRDGKRTSDIERPGV